MQHTNTSSMSSGSTTCLFYRDLRARQLTTRSLHDISNRFERTRKAFRDHLWFTLTRTKSDENARNQECCKRCFTRTRSRRPDTQSSATLVAERSAHSLHIRSATFRVKNLSRISGYFSYGLN